ncbi:hypothetical protein vBRpoSV10_181 [Ruegeria phage vB_RpoS-V10]|nr:hypothetical protein vBRpoSV10_181 [Ruegeria phage vB_RpoS-V10]
MMQDFKKGQTLYTMDGTQVTFDHQYVGYAYVYPVLTVVHQTSTYSGDDFHEEEDKIDADHLLAIPMNKLTSVKPTQVLDDEITARKTVLAEVNAKIAEVKRDTDKLQRDNAAAITRQENQIKQWGEKYPLFEDTARFLEGKPMFPLIARDHRYGRTYDVPSVPTMREIQYLTLQPATHVNRYQTKKKVEVGDLQWVATRSLSNRDNHESITFFHSEEERNAAVTEMFQEVLVKFRAKPDYLARGYSSDLDFGRLLAWVERFTFLTIPDDITKGKEDHDQAKRQQEADVLRKRLAEMEG